MWTEVEKSTQEQMKINKQTKIHNYKKKSLWKKTNKQNFSLSHTRDKTKKTSFFFLPNPTLTIFLILYTF